MCSGGGKRGGRSVCAHAPPGTAPGAFPLTAPAQYNLPPPGYRGYVPHTITFQRKRANRRVINEDQMVKMLAEFGDVSRRAGVGFLWRRSAAQWALGLLFMLGALLWALVLL